MSINGSLPPRPTAVKGATLLEKERQMADAAATVAASRTEPAMVNTYPLLRRILQSSKLLKESVNLKE